ncbi:conserved Plasmodium protein, unknown function [Plasmodium malariae]|uniref:Uncharacterized protein n=1 Tax=Plasmodium malariae TaxID=5858 RepID=A0A1A8X6Z8_PLAMA|nr:conserved Plasmodium protein, unknown function [Plasmodium malariae]
MNDVLKCKKRIREGSNVNNTPCWTSYHEVDNYVKRDDYIMRKREKIRNICKKINNFRNKICNSSEYFKFVEILFNKAGKKCVPKKKNKNKINKSPQNNEKKKWCISSNDIFFNGYISHVEIFDSKKFHLFFDKYFYINNEKEKEKKESTNPSYEDVLERNKRNTSSCTNSSTIERINIMQTSKSKEEYKKSYRKKNGKGVNNTEDVTSKKKEEYTFKKTEKTNDTFFDTCYNEELSCIDNVGSTEVFTTSDNRRIRRREKTQISSCDNGSNSPFMKRRKVIKYENNMNTMLVSSDNFKNGICKLSKGIDNKIVNSKQYYTNSHEEVRPGKSDRLNNTYYIRKRIIIFKIENILFDSVHTEQEQLLYRVDKSVEYAFKDSRDNKEQELHPKQQSHHQNNKEVAKKQIYSYDNTKERLQSPNITQNSGELNKSSHYKNAANGNIDEFKKNVLFFYNMFLKLSLHINTLFSTCIELLKYDFSDLSYKSKALSHDSKMLITLINTYQKQEKLVINYSKYILYIAKRCILRNNSTKKGIMMGDRGSRIITVGELLTIRKLIRILLKWKNMDVNISVKFTRYEMRNKKNVYKIEIVNHRLIKYNFVLRKIYFCKYNNKIIIYLRRLLSLLHHSYSDDTRTNAGAALIKEYSVCNENESGLKERNVSNEELKNMRPSHNALSSVSTFTGFNVKNCLKEHEESANIKEVENLKEKGESQSISGMSRSSIGRNGSNSRSSNEDDINNNVSSSNNRNSNDGNGNVNAAGFSSLNYEQELNINQLQIIIYLNNILTKEVNYSDMLRMQSKLQEEQINEVFLEIKNIYNFLVPKDDLAQKEAHNIVQHKKNHLAEHDTSNAHRKHSKFVHFKKQLLKASFHDNMHLVDEEPHSVKQYKCAATPQSAEFFSINLNLIHGSSRSTSSCGICSGNSTLECHGACVDGMKNEQGVNDLSICCRDNEENTDERETFEEEIDYLFIKKEKKKLKHKMKQKLKQKMKHKMKHKMKQKMKQKIKKKIKKKNNVCILKNMIKSILIYLVKYHGNSCKECITKRVEVEERREEEHLSEVPQGRNNNIKDESEITKRENSTLYDFLEREKKIIDELRKEIKKKNNVINEININLEREKEKNQEMHLLVEKEKIINDVIMKELQNEQKIRNELNQQLRREKEEKSNIRIELIKEIETNKKVSNELYGSKRMNNELDEQLESVRKMNNDGSSELQGEKEVNGRLKIELEEEKEVNGRLKIELEEEKEVNGRLKIELEEEKEMSGRLNTELEEEKEMSGRLNTELEEEKEMSGRLKTELEEEKEMSGRLKTELEEEKEMSGRLKTELEEEKEVNGRLKIELEEEKEVNGRLKIELEEEKEVNGRLMIELDEEKEMSGRLKTELEEEKVVSGNLRIKLDREKEAFVDVSLALDKEKKKYIDMCKELEEKEEMNNELSTELLNAKKASAESNIELERRVYTEMEEELAKEREVSAHLRVEKQAEKEAKDRLNEELQAVKKFSTDLNVELQVEKNKTKEQNVKIKEQESLIEKMMEKLQHKQNRLNHMKINEEEKETKDGAKIKDASEQSQMEEKKVRIVNMTMQNSNEKHMSSVKKGCSSNGDNEEEHSEEYDKLYYSYIETVIKKEDLEKEYEYMMKHLDGKMNTFDKNVEYFDEKIIHYKNVCNNYEQRFIYISKYINTFEKIISDIEKIEYIKKDIILQNKINKIKIILKEININDPIEIVGTDNLLFDQILDEKNKLLEKYENEDKEKVKEKDTHMNDLNDELKKYMDELSFKTVNDLFSFHLCVLDELNLMKKYYNQLVEENVMKNREYENNFLKLNKSLENKEKEIITSRENCKSLLLEVNNLKYILNELFACEVSKKGVEVDAIKEEATKKEVGTIRDMATAKETAATMEISTMNITTDGDEVDIFLKTNERTSLISEKSGEKISEKSGEKISETSDEKISEKSGEKISEQSGEKISEKSNKKISEKSNKKISEKSNKKKGKNNPLPPRGSLLTEAKTKRGGSRKYQLRSSNRKR